MKRIAILTSSRADYGIYLPLLKALEDDPFFELQIIVFGTHLSPFHGYTINQILNDGFEVSFQIESMLTGDSPNAISTAMALTSLKFADFWKEHKTDFDLVFCLGDRYEMFAAVTSGIPFNIPFAHLHGGEKTLGAIDNIFRHAITLASKYHFVSCKEHGERVAELIESKDNIFDIGALSLDKLKTLPLLSIEDFNIKFGVNLNQPTILVTVHPETVTPEKNQKNVEELAATLLELEKYQVIITLPNADTNGTLIRKKLLQLPAESVNGIFCFENLGSQGYFTAVKYCSFLLGNTSSGIIEAASFGKYVINLGNRQEGRKQSQNIYNMPFNKTMIVQSVAEIENNPDYLGENIYYKGNAAQTICFFLKNID
ncbi:UDP-N-acetylglucosamine 2-epimerase [Aquipluma nitroreducens]|uniref:UDP-N-acetylglucosamine 2-epimerase n=1 Tax=Aquipluma nitroreducens TaxID=2010828 RepID=A0A5K7S418_9BACT|nr:UDP-N-acetylglucosamine 2-epimerase [Aquipluma nitroreducens]BBE16220.1 UDP-N-acetylglucosamine 2-epimerase [Aquipluma nitroreducens]